MILSYGVCHLGGLSHGIAGATGMDVALSRVKVRLKQLEESERMS